MKGVYLLLGSNLGESRKMLELAKNQIEEKIGEVVMASSVYKTKAWGIEDQPDFLNQVLEINSNLEPEKMLTTILEIEQHLGRIRYKKWYTRIIDIDILYYGNKIVDLEDLKIPHPENQNRNFVLVPLCEIAPDFIHPKLGISQKELLERSPDTLEVHIT